MTGFIMAKKRVNAPENEPATQSEVALKAAERAAPKAASMSALRIGQIGDYKPIPKFKGCRNC